MNFGTKVRGIRTWLIERPLVSLWLGALVFAGLLWVARAASVNLAIRPNALPTQAEGYFARKSYPAEMTDPDGFPAIRGWGSWGGHDRFKGKLAMGPFRTGEDLDLFIGGFPETEGLVLRLVRVSDGAIHPLRAKNVGHRWSLQSFTLPRDWAGEEVRLEAVDDAEGNFSWFAISEPVSFYVDGRLGQHLFIWALCALVFAPPFLVSYRWIQKNAWVPPGYEVMAACGVTALIGYVLLAITFFDPWLGRFIALGVIVRSAWSLRPGEQGAPELSAEASSTLQRVFLVGLFCITMMGLWNHAAEYPELAQIRFHGPLPSDNEMPGLFAQMLLRGGNVVQIGTDWLTSDRPPLQTGWNLLVLPFTDLLGLPPPTVSSIAGLWLQLLWVPALGLLLGHLGVASRRLSASIFLLATTGFFLLHTTFVWPKLAAGSFAIAAFSLWILHPDRQKTRFVLAGAVFASLGWLCHGGVAFSFLALIPWVLWRFIRGPKLPWLAATALVIIVNAPWAAYQRYYAPPANRLLKWYLGGQIPIDDRGVVQTIRENYARASRDEVVEARVANFRRQFGRDWSNFLPSSEPRVHFDRRSSEFFDLGRTVGLWWLGAGVFLFLLATRRHPGLNGASLAHAVGWALAGQAVWIAVLFEKDAAVVHQGTFVAPMTAFALCVSGLVLLPLRWAVALASLPVLYTVSTWYGPGREMPAVVNPAALVALALLALAAWRHLSKQFQSHAP